jgi:hypothetical protein
MAERPAADVWKWRRAEVNVLERAPPVMRAGGTIERSAALVLDQS